MSDLISRQAAIDEIRKCRFVANAIEKIIGLPFAQPAPDTIYADGFCDGYKQGIKDAQSEIVRCKDCKHWREHKYAKETKRYIPFCGLNAIYTKSDDFCSRAERREG